MTVTVAICTRNRSELLRETLEGLTRLDAPPQLSWELLVIDNNSTDSTPAVIESFQHQLPLRHVVEREPGLSPARNRAIAESTSELILWTDDDVLVDRNWLREFVAAARAHPTATGFGGRIEPWFRTQPDPDLVQAFPWLDIGFCGLNYEAEDHVLPADRYVYGANMGFRRSLVEGMLFDRRLGPKPGVAGGGDELDFQDRARAKGGQVVWWPAMSVKHLVPPARMTLAYLEGFAREKGREFVLRQGAKVEAVRSIFGVPRWLWRAWVEVWGKALLASTGVLVPLPSHLWSPGVPGQSASRRVNAMVWKRERSFLAGMMAAHREMERAQGSVTLTA